MMIIRYNPPIYNLSNRYNNIALFAQLSIPLLKIALSLLLKENE